MRILVIGCGSIGVRHAQNAARKAEVAVYDALPDAARRCAAATGARVFERLEDALAWKPAAAVVATPHRSHLELASRAIVAGANVLVEKPLSDSLDGVSAFLELARESGRHAYVGCNMRFHPGPATLRRSLARIGQPLFARAHVGNYLPAMRPGRDYRELYAARRAEGGGVILDAIHELDYLAWMLGEIESVCCQAAKLSDLEIDVEDYALVALTHGGGSRSSTELDYLRRHKSRGCEIVGVGGTLRWQSDGKMPERCVVQLLPDGTTNNETLVEISSVDPAQPYRDMMDAFLDEIAQPGSTEMLDAATAAGELTVARAAHESSRRAGAAIDPRQWSYDR